MSDTVSHLLDRFAKLVHPLECEDRTAMKVFLSRYFHPRYILIDDSFFDWQYLDNPCNIYEKYSVKIIKMANEFMGYLGLIPWRLKVFDHTYGNSGALCNLMIDSKCRALGLGSVLVRECQRDFAVLTGTSYKPKTGPMYEKLGNWFQLGNLSRYILIVNARQCALIENPADPDYVKYSSLALLKNNIRCADCDNVTFHDVDEFGEEISDLWDNICADYPITVERSARYLNWRYAQHPQLKYLITIARVNDKIAGYAVLRIEESEEGRYKYTVGKIIDVFAASSVRRQLLEYCVSMMKDRNVDFIDFMFTGRMYAQTLKDIGFIDADEFEHVSLPYVFQPIERHRKHINFLVYISDELIHLREHIANIDNWYLTRADGDQDRPNRWS